MAGHNGRLLVSLCAHATKSRQLPRVGISSLTQSCCCDIHPVFRLSPPVYPNSFSIPYLESSARAADIFQKVVFLQPLRSFGPALLLCCAILCALLDVGTHLGCSELLLEVIKKWVGSTRLKSAFKCAQKHYYVQFGKALDIEVGRHVSHFELVPLHSASAPLFRDTILAFKSDCKHSNRSKEDP